jgi:inner membrane protein
MTVVGSLLPDIDHTKSWIGKAFYPLAKWLATNYGHRTITHSLLFIFSITIISIFIEKNFSDNYTISAILFFSVFSHFLFDMITLQGIPLFYPFYKNPCVLPANPELRIKSGNIRQEGVILFIFCFLTFFMQDLFANGFWSTINNKFNDVKHQMREYKKSDYALITDYDYNIYQTNFKGKGYLLQAEENELYITTDKGLIHIDKLEQGLKINLLKTTKSNFKIIQKKLPISNLTEEEINKILESKFISNGTIYTNYATSLTTNTLELKKKFELKNKYKIQFISHIADTLNQDKQKKIAELQLKIKAEENQNINENKDHYLNIKTLEQEKYKLSQNLSNYELNEVKKHIIELESKIENHHFKENLMIKEYKNSLAKLLKTELNKITYSGEINYIEILK